MKKIFYSIIALVTLGNVNAQITKSQIGMSRYDLQTNSSMERRIAVDPATNRMIVNYTGSNATDQNFFDRGCGYAFFDGVSVWKNHKGDVFTPPYDTFIPRLEPKRVGWPGPNFVGTGERIITHVADNNTNGLFIARRTPAGSGAWVTAQITNGPETWPRSAASGNKMVAISSVFQTTFNGVTGGIQIIKSTDGGVNWTLPDTIGGINATNYTALGGDIYDLDLKGDTIAIMSGASDVSLFKSTDFGVTWTVTSMVAMSNNQASANATFAPKSDQSDGSFSVVLDKMGVAHCFWGRQSVFFNPAQAGFFLDIDKTGIMYWNEKMGSQMPIVVPGTDLIREHKNSPTTPNFATRYNLSATSTSALYRDGYKNNLVTWPSSGIDSANNLYLTFAYNRGRMDTMNTGIGKDQDKSGFTLNDIYTMKSLDNGKTWIGPLNVTNTPNLESAFPSMAKNVTNMVNIVYMEDSLYGNAVAAPAGGTGNGTGSHGGGIIVRNKIMVASLNTNDIVNPANDNQAPTMTTSNYFDDLISTKGLTDFKLVLFKGCNIDTVTGKPIVLSKKWLMENIVEFRDNKHGQDSNIFIVDKFSNVNLNAVGTYTMKMWGKDSAGNMTINQGIFMDTLELTIEVLAPGNDLNIQLVGTNPIYVYLNGSYTDEGANVITSNPCGDKTYTTNNNVNTSNKGNQTIVYVAKGDANKTVTRNVYVGVEPTSIISNEAIVAGKITAKGTTSLDTNYSPGYKWGFKKAGTATITFFNPGLTAPSITNYGTTVAFDSLCLEVTNVFNRPNFNKKAKSTCVYLKKTGAGIGTVNNDLTINIYPNPSNGNFNVKINGNKSNTAKFTLINSVGQVINQQEVKVNNSDISLNNNLSKGTYFITTEIDGNVQMNRVEVE